MCQTDFPESEDLEKNKEVVDFIYDYAKDNIAVAKLFIKDPYYTSIKRDRAVTFVSFLGNAGGLLGLCMGFSLISAIEWIYHFLIFIVNVCVIACQSKQEVQQNNRVGPINVSN